MIICTTNTQFNCLKPFSDDSVTNIYMNFGDFFVVISFLMQSIPLKLHILFTVFPSKLCQVCKNCQTYDQLLIHQVLTAKNAFLLLIQRIVGNAQYCNCTDFKMTVCLKSLEKLLVLTFRHFHQFYPSLGSSNKI